MRILYDIAVLGTGHIMPHARTGIYRVVERIASELAASAECEIVFCGGESYHRLNLALDFLEDSRRFDQVPVLAPPENRYLRRLRNHARDTPGRLCRLRRMASIYLARGLDLVASPLKSGDLRAFDVYHSPLHPLPRRLRHSGVPRFVTLYDLIALRRPDLFTPQVVRLIRGVAESLDRESWALCISEATKQDACELLGLDPARVFVTPLAAADEIFHPVADADRVAQVRGKLGVPDAPYLLSVNTLEPRKNIEHAIRCFLEVVEAHSIDDLYFVLAGARGWNYDTILATASRTGIARNKVIITGYVADEDLAPLYSGALAFVYPSLFEGFGLPPLEAMQCGVPVITSNTSSLPEVVGDSGLLVDPTDADALRQCMLEIYRDAELRASLVEKSKARARLFSWERCARETIAAYRTASTN